MSQAKSPKFSIIINVYNGEKDLPEALASVFAQTFKDWELIIWDNKSTDNTAAICNRLDDERVRYYCAPEHTSVGPARNLIVRLARGEWLAFLDHDDIWMPDKLAEQSRLIDQDTTGKLGIVYGWTVQFYESGKIEAFDRWHSRDHLPSGDVFRELIAKPCFIPYSCTALKRSATLEIGDIPTSIGLTSDYYLILMVARNYLAAPITKTLCKYRKHKASISYTARSRIVIHNEVLEILDICADDIDPDLAERRRRVHMTHIGLLEIVTGDAVLQGMVRIVTKGSLAYLLSRPFTVSTRYVRRLFSGPVDANRSR